MTDNQWQVVMQTSTDFKKGAHVGEAGDEGSTKPWRIIKQGANLKGVCQNSSCNQKGVEVIDSSKGTNEVDVSRPSGVAHCPSCKKAFNITNLTFFRCHWNVDFGIRQADNDIIEGTNGEARRANDNELHTWKDGGGMKIMYTRFIIKTQVTKCLAGDTWVDLGRGQWRQVKDLTPGTRLQDSAVKAVWHKTFQSPQVLVDIQSLLPGDPGPFASACCPVLVTPDHPILLHGKWILPRKIRNLPRSETLELWNVAMEDKVPIAIGQPNGRTIMAQTVGAEGWQEEELIRWMTSPQWSRRVIHEQEEIPDEEGGISMTGENPASPCYSRRMCCVEFLGDKVTPRNIMQVPPRCANCNSCFLATELHSANLPSGWCLRRGLRKPNGEIIERGFGSVPRLEPDDGKPRHHLEQLLFLPIGWQMTFCEISTPH